MANAISLFDPTKLAAPSKKPLAEIKQSSTTSGDFKRRLQLFSKGSLVDQGLIHGGEYGIPEGESVENLGKAVDVFILAVRQKAMDVSDTNAITTSFDETSALYADIVDRSSGQDSGCMYGPEFLVVERKSGEILTFFCGTKSQRRAAAVIIGNVQKPVTLSAKFIKKPKYSWFVTETTACKASFDKMPSMDVLNAEITKFLEEKGSDVVVEDAKTPARSR